MGEMTPKERAVKVLEIIYRCKTNSGRIFECKGCILKITGAMADARADQRKADATIADGLAGKYGAEIAAAILKAPEPKP